jgi:nitroreductase
MSSPTSPIPLFDVVDPSIY